MIYLVVIKNYKSSKQIALFFQLGILVLMAIAIPVATNLVGKTADNRNLAAGDECDAIGTPSARQLCRAKKAAKVTTSSSGSGGSGECSHDSDCGSAANCAYCSAGKCISGCTAGKPTFGKINNTAVVVAPTVVKKKDGESTLVGSSQADIDKFESCLNGKTDMGTVIYCKKNNPNFDVVYYILSKGTVPTAALLAKNPISGEPLTREEYRQCLGSNILLYESVDDSIKDCNSTYGASSVTDTSICCSTGGTYAKMSQLDCQQAGGSKADGKCTVVPTVSLSDPSSSGSSSSGGNTSTSGSTTKKTSSNNRAPVSSGCKEECPGSDGVLRNCTGVVGQSLCNQVNRVEMCGTKCFICPTVGGKWNVTDISKCPVVGLNPVLNYKIAFGGVMPNSSQCLVSWPLQITVLGDGESKTYVNVLPDSITTVGNKRIVSGSLVLTNFSKTTGVSAFITGPKHLQMKYGKNNQTGPYGKLIGELTLTNDKATSIVYDFSGYPIIPGDVSGVSGVQDKFVNAVDFALVKSKSLVHETVQSGGYLIADLDGNCQVNSNDVNLLTISLQDKQEQLY
ncbi:MAG: hypothetical protein WC069_00875 [Candidatus Shapirobacteria bacterium]